MAASMAASFPAPRATSRASPSRARASRLNVTCARKPVRLSRNKKKAKEERTREKKSRRVGGGGDDDAAALALDGLSPQQRVDASKHAARRWLGQHFLVDRSVILDALDAADVRAGDSILEIGPGTGNLTAELLSAGAVVTAVEKDRNLADKLAETFRGNENLTVHEADFLKWNVAKAFPEPTDAAAADAALGDGAPRRAKVVANIPYNITTDILKVLLPMGDTFENMVFMFQEEVARRLIRDDAGGSDYRPMSVRVRYYSEPYYVRPVSAACFDPPPNVESCLIGFRPRRREEYLPLAGTERQFFAFVQTCFAQKRKMLKNNMRAACDDDTIRDALATLNRPEKTRAQELSMEEYVELFNFVRARGGAREGGVRRRGEDSDSGGEDSDSGGDSGQRESASARERRAKVESMTARLVAQATGRGAREEATGPREEEEDDDA